MYLLIGTIYTVGVTLGNLQFSVFWKSCMFVQMTHLLGSPPHLPSAPALWQVFAETLTLRFSQCHLHQKSWWKFCKVLTPEHLNTASRLFSFGSSLRFSDTSLRNSLNERLRSWVSALTKAQISLMFGSWWPKPTQRSIPHASFRLKTPSWTHGQDTICQMSLCGSLCRYQSLCIYLHLFLLVYFVSLSPRNGSFCVAACLLGTLYLVLCLSFM